MTISVKLAPPFLGVSVHPSPVSPSTASGEAQDRPSGATPGRNTTHAPRRMVAVTIALSEPMDSAPLDWAATIASVMRLTYANTTVEVIDSWRVDQ